MPKKSGFTLIELLITITIIAILSAIGIVVYSNVAKQGRDSKRQSDLKTIQSALDQYFTDQGYYPYEYTASCDGAKLTGNFKVLCALTNIGGTKTYLKQVPNDPFNGNYCYRSLNCDSNFSRCTTYELHAKLESSSDPEYEVGSVCGNEKYNFKITPP